MLLLACVEGGNVRLQSQKPFPGTSPGETGHVRGGKETAGVVMLQSQDGAGATAM